VVSHKQQINWEEVKELTEKLRYRQLLYKQVRIRPKYSAIVISRDRGLRENKNKPTK